jgi:hypothetical protein
MPTTPFQPTITLGSDQPQSDAERNFIDETPPNIFPENSDSNWGFKRKIFCEIVQEAIDQLDTLYQERFIDSSNQFLDEWEAQMLVPVAPAGFDVISRRSIVKNRLKKGSFTRDRMNHLVENAILSTLGTPTQFTPDGLALDANGITLYGETLASALPSLYRLHYAHDNFGFDVVIRSDVAINVANLYRELVHFVPAGMNFSILSQANVRDYQRIVIADGPTGYWPLCTTIGTGNPWQSIVGPSQILTPAGSPANVSALVQRGGLSISDTGSRDFNGTTDYAVAPAYAGYAFGSGPYTLECWVMPDALPAGGLDAYAMSHFGDNLAGAGRLGIYNSTGTAPQWYFYSARGIDNISIEIKSPTPTPTIGSVYHIVGTWTGRIAKLYVNGVKVGEMDAGENFVPGYPFNAQGLYIGRYAHVSTHFWNGKIDEPTIYGYALSDAQILRHYQTGLDTG